MAGAHARIVATAAIGLVLTLAALDGFSNPPAAPAVEPAPAKPPPVTEKALTDELDVLLRSLGQLRGITARGTVARRLLSPPELRAEIAAVVGKHDRAGELETTTLLLTRLGLLPEGADYAQLLADALSAQPTSFYDPLSRRLLVPSAVDLPTQRVPLAHELAHALADQRFGLRRVLGFAAGDGRARETDSDRRRARQALVEGDAATAALELFDPRGVLLSRRELGAMVQRLRGATTAPPPPPAAAPPVVIHELLAFPLVEGLVFVGRIRGRQPWAAVDAVWARPPDSTEQILHPERYDRNDPPVAIVTAPLPPLVQSHRLAGSDTLGELIIRLWLSRFVSTPVAERAAEGWGGDRAAIYLPATGGAERSPAAVLAWMTVWDSPADAEDFATTATAALAGLAGTTADDDDVFRDPDGNAFALSRRGDRVALLLGAPGEVKPTLEALFQWRSPTAPAPPTKPKPTPPPTRPRPRR